MVAAHDTRTSLSNGYSPGGVSLCASLMLYFNNFWRHQWLALTLSQFLKMVVPPSCYSPHLEWQTSTKNPFRIHLYSQELSKNLWMGPMKEEYRVEIIFSGSTRVLRCSHFEIQWCFHDGSLCWAPSLWISKKILPSTEVRYPFHLVVANYSYLLPLLQKTPPFEEHLLFQSGRLTTYALLTFVDPLSILLRRRCYGILVATGVMEVGVEGRNEGREVRKGSKGRKEGVKEGKKGRQDGRGLFQPGIWWRIITQASLVFNVQFVLFSISFRTGSGG